jgi:hypothetical protein
MSSRDTKACVSERISACGEQTSGARRLYGGEASGYRARMTASWRCSRTHLRGGNACRSGRTTGGTPQASLSRQRVALLPVALEEAPDGSTPGVPPSPLRGETENHEPRTALLHGCRARGLPRPAVADRGGDHLYTRRGAARSVGRSGETPRFTRSDGLGSGFEVQGSRFPRTRIQPPHVHNPRERPHAVLTEIHRRLRLQSNV